MLLTRLRAVLLLAAVCAAAWVVLGLAIVLRLAALERTSAAQILWLTSVVVPRAASIGFDSGAAFAVALFALSARSIHDVRVRLGGPMAAALVSSLASGRLGLEPAVLAALVCGAWGFGCGIVLLALVSVRTDCPTRPRAGSLTNAAELRR